MNGPIRNRSAEAEALQARFALRVAARLSEGSEKLPHDLSERLRVAREQAIARARQLQLTQAAAVGVHHAGQGSLALSPPPSLWLRVASLMPMVLLLAGVELVALSTVKTAGEEDEVILLVPLPVPFTMLATVWLKPLRSKVALLPAVCPTVNTVAEGRTSALPIFRVPFVTAVLPQL